MDRLWGQAGRFEVVERPAADGDHVTIDVVGRVDGEVVRGLTVTGYEYEVGTGGDIPELNDQLRGSVAGDVLTFDAPHPDGTGSIAFEVTVHDVREHTLPDYSSEWAGRISKFETVAELRADVRRRMDGVRRIQAREALREAAD